MFALKIFLPIKISVIWRYFLCFKRFIFMYMCVSVCLWVCVHVFRCLQRSEEGIRYPGSGVTCSLSCPPWLLAYKFIHCKNKGCSQLLSHVSSPLNTESQTLNHRGSNMNSTLTTTLSWIHIVFLSAKIYYLNIKYLVYVWIGYMCVMSLGIYNLGREIWYKRN